ncbi:MAG: glycosyltransferase family 2 protein [Desulfonauticus sp.]|nr:glycosyltransferase family 2 protein [Desulfonauticus sp.]
MLKNKPLISVIIPTYNRKYFLEKISIPSVLRQTYPNFELIVVDDHSQDDTERLIKKWSKKDKRIKYIKNFRTKGVSGARNSGILSAKGDYISLLDSDDAWVHEHLENLLEVLENYSHIDIVSAGAVMVDLETGKKIREFFLSNYKKTPGFFVRPDLYKFSGDLFHLSFSNFICNTQAMLSRKNVFNEVLYPEDLRVCEDCFLVHHMAYKGFSFSFYPSMHSIWYVHDYNTLDYQKHDISKAIKNFYSLLQYYDKILNSFEVSSEIRRFLNKKKADVYFWNLAYNSFLKIKDYNSAYKYFLKGLYLNPWDFKKWKTFSIFLLSLPFRKFIRRLS